MNLVQDIRQSLAMMEEFALRTEILGVGFDDLSLAEAVSQGVRLLEEDGFHYVVTPNPELVDRAGREDAFCAALNGADMVLPDGIGVVYASRILGRPLKGRCPGIDFASGLMEVLAQTGKRLYLLGAKPGVAEAAALNLQGQYPGIIICGVHDGYFKDGGPVAADIYRTGADVVFVCLGAPKQEYWMVEFGPQTGARLLVGLGGSLDVFAGVVKRAPEVWKKLGLEWLYRLKEEPSRIGRMARLPLFLVEAAGERLKRQ